MTEINFAVEAKRLCRTLEALLPSFHVPNPDATILTGGNSSVTVKLPLKVVALAGALAWRAHDFATLSADLCENDRIIPAAVIGRSLMETTALFYLVHKKVKGALAARDVNSLDDFLVRCLSGNRLDNDELQSPNVLTAIQSLEKEPGADGNMKFYDVLSEFAHPNALGTFYSYSSFDDDTRTVLFGHNQRVTQGNAILFAVVFALEILLEFFGKLADSLPAITELARDTYFQDRSVQ